jgi:uncharacterized protein YgiM (DUF1202 family)
MNRNKSPYAPQLTRITVGCALLIFSGCQWAATGGQSRSEARAASDAATASELRVLRQQTRDQKLEITNLEAQRQALTELNRVLEEELSATESDLKQVERQFVSMERRLIRDESKASAVATIAEVRLLLDHLTKQDPCPIDDQTVADVEDKLASANDLTRKRSYSAAVYYANRARRILNHHERRREAIANRKIISVTRANLRSGPGSGFKVLARLEYGTVVQQIADQDAWRQIRLANGTEGWIHADLIR